MEAFKVLRLDRSVEHGWASRPVASELQCVHPATRVATSSRRLVAHGPDDPSPHKNRRPTRGGRHLVQLDHGHPAAPATTRPSSSRSSRVLRGSLLTTSVIGRPRAQPPRGLGHESGRGGLGVGHQHELVGTHERSLGRGSCRPVPQSSNRIRPAAGGARSAACRRCGPSGRRARSRRAQAGPSGRCDCGRGARPARWTGRSGAQQVEQIIGKNVVIGGERPPSEPKSGLVSTATTRSGRMWASSEPISTVSVVLPTPPFGDTTASVGQRCSRGAAIASSSRRR